MYGLVIVAVIMFGLTFFTNEKYQKETGSGLYQAMHYNLLCCVLSLPIMFAFNGFKIEYTHFTLVFALLACANNLLFIICSLHAFNRVNLSVYSMLCMLGGMLLPVVVGIVFYNEKITLGLILCIVFVIVSLAIMLDKKSGTKKGGFLIYAGVFVFNGLSGVLSKIYTDATMPKASSMGYSLLIVMVTLVICLIAVLCLHRKRISVSKTAVFSGLVSGPLSKIANYFLLVALAVLPSSVNYSFVTGGTIIVSTIIACFTKNKPKTREWIAVAIAFVGILLLTLL